MQGGAIHREQSVWGLFCQQLQNLLKFERVLLVHGQLFQCRRSMLDLQHSIMFGLLVKASLPDLHSALLPHSRQPVQNLHHIKLRWVLFQGDREVQRARSVLGVPKGVRMERKTQILFGESGGRWLTLVVRHYHRDSLHKYQCFYAVIAVAVACYLYRCCLQRRAQGNDGEMRGGMYTEFQEIRWL